MAENNIEYIEGEVELQLPIKEIQERIVFGEKEYIITDSSDKSYRFQKNIFNKKATTQKYFVSMFLPKKL